jgi:hypothetical protein
MGETLEDLGVSEAVRIASSSPRGIASALKVNGDISDELIALSLERYEELAPRFEVVTAEEDNKAKASDVYERLLDIGETADIDAGEAQLMALVAVGDADSVMYSGDKRAILDLRRTDTQIFKQIENRIVSFERCLLRISEVRGTAYVMDKARVGRRCDGALSTAFGSEGSASEDDFLKALNSYDPLV